MCDEKDGTAHGERHNSDHDGSSALGRRQQVIVVQLTLLGSVTVSTLYPLESYYHLRYASTIDSKVPVPGVRKKQKYAIGVGKVFDCFLLVVVERL
jgi:hypothetical protein